MLQPGEEIARHVVALIADGALNADSAAKLVAEIGRGAASDDVADHGLPAAADGVAEGGLPAVADHGLPAAADGMAERGLPAADRPVVGGAPGFHSLPVA